MIQALEFLAVLSAALFAGAAHCINFVEHQARMGLETRLVAALLIGAVVPFTFGIIMPTNHQLLAHGRDLTSLETRDLLVRWGQLHAVRTALSVAATLVYLSLALAR